MNDKTSTKFHSSVKSVGALPDTSGSKGVCADLKRLRGKFNSPFKFTSGFKKKCAVALMLSAVSFQARPSLPQGGAKKGNDER